VTGTGATIRQAISTAYGGIERIEYEGRQFRRDIGHRALNRAN
jgi:phosphoribosylamine-glycine ligase